MINFLWNKEDHFVMPIVVVPIIASLLIVKLLLQN